MKWNVCILGDTTKNEKENWTCNVLQLKRKLDVLQLKRKLEGKQ